MKTSLIFFFWILLPVVNMNRAAASFLIERSGAADPLTQGFSQFGCCGASATAPIANDLGHAAWSISGLTQASQYGYESSTLSTAQLNDIANNGFVLTAQARAVRGLAPSYDAVNHVVICGFFYDTGTKRYEIALGLDSNGDTVVVLPNSIDNAGPGFSIRAPGPSFTMVGLGSSYHTYQLLFDPSTQLADLLIDGMKRIEGYAGHTSSVLDYHGLVWGAYSGGQGNFDLVSLESVPEPTTIMLCLSALAIWYRPRSRAYSIASAPSMRSSGGPLAQRSVLALCLGVLLSISQYRAAEASFLIERSGAADPTTQGFSQFGCCGASATAPIANDLGHAAWSISGLTQASQFGYKSAALSAVQLDDLVNNGFVLTAQARAVQVLAPSYDAASHIVICAFSLDTGTKRYEVDLGLDTNGDTVVVLPTSIDSGGPGQSIRAPGPSYALVGSGSSYHAYQLVLNPATQLADLFVDGVKRIQSYAGHTSFVGNRGLVWSAFSGGRGNFDLVRLESVPEPTSLSVLLCVTASLVGWGRARYST